MAIEFEVTDINTVDEEMRSAYVEVEGKHRFDPDKFYELKAAALIKKNQELIGKQKTLAEQVKSLEKVKTSAETDVDKIAAEKDRQISELRGELRESKIWTPVQQQALKSGVIPDRLEALMTILRAQGRFDQDDSSKLIFKDKFGDETAIKPERAFDHYLKEEFPWAFAASQTGGSGAKNGAGKVGGSKTILRERFDAMPQSEKEKAITEGYKIID